MQLESVEVPVAMKQMQPVCQAARGNENIHCPTHGEPQTSQPSVVSGRLDGKLGAANGQLLQPSEQAPGFIEALVVREALQHLCKYQVANDQPLIAKVFIEPFSLSRGAIPKEIDPDA